MEPFNIRICLTQQPITLTILPVSDYYKIIYFGGILGAITFKNKHWKLILPEEVEAGDLPPYTNNADEIREEIVLNDQNTQKIGEEIEKSHSNQD